MPQTRTALVLALTVSIAGLAADGQQSPANRPWPPGVQKVASESPPLPAMDALKTFYMPPGYRVELVASEPTVQEPVAMDWDLDGRLWVVEMPGFMADLTGSNEHEPIGRVVVLEDADGDGDMDKRTIFADGLVLARSIKVLDRGVLVAEPPNVWLMRDTNGDLRMDTKELVTNRYGRFDADPQNNANGFLWGLDNRLHTAGMADVQLRLRDAAFEIQRTLQRGEWGVAEDDRGRIYRNTNESALHVDLVPTAYFARNPNLVRTRGSYERLADENPDLNIVWPVRPNPGTNRAYQTGIDRPDGSLARFTSVCAPVVYRGDRLPADVYGNVFVAEPAANLVSRLVLETSGPDVRARKAYEQGEFLASTDERFRPVYLSNAPDGTLYIADMYRGIIEHRISVTEYLRDQILSRQLDRHTGYGRIYRVVHETTTRDTTRVLAKPTTARLVDALQHPNGWWRDTAQRLIVERHLTDAVPALTKLVGTAAEPRTRLRALWTLDGLDAIQPQLVTAALKDPAADVRVAAVRIAERWLVESTHPTHAPVLALVDDPDAAVRRQLAASLGFMPAASRDPALVRLLDRYGVDAIVVDAAVSSMRGSELTVLNALLRQSDRTVERENATAMIAATIVRSLQDAEIQSLFELIGDRARPEWQRSALLKGPEIALLAAAMPGTPGRKPLPAPPAALPCPTCPGGRAGPGGAYAFTRPDPSAGRAGRGAGPAVRLRSEPVALSALASNADEMAPRVAAVLARVIWPGKAGAEAAPTPLTAAERQRFDAGREIYRNVCQGCHQPDGRGQEKLAPSLVGSTMALAAADIPVRVLLNGKEGPTGLMPPIGSTLNDDQVAAVLTYIRNEWGQSAAPVAPEAVAAVRTVTGDRKRPWTDDELRKLMGAGNQD